VSKPLKFSIAMNTSILLLLCCFLRNVLSMQAAGISHLSPGNRLASAGGLVPRPRACPNPQYLLSKARVVKLRASKNNEDKINDSEEAFKELIIKAQAMAAKEKKEDARESEMMLKEWNELLKSRETKVEKCTINKGGKIVCKTLDFLIDGIEKIMNSTIVPLQDENVYLKLIRNKDGNLSVTKAVAVFFATFIVVVPVSLSLICTAEAIRHIRELALKLDI
jgi:hypothetical protein